MWRDFAVQVLQHVYGVGRTRTGGSTRTEGDTDIGRTHGQQLLGGAHEPFLCGNITWRTEFQADGLIRPHAVSSPDSRPETIRYKIAPRTAPQKPSPAKPLRTQ